MKRARTWADNTVYIVYELVSIRVYEQRLYPININLRYLKPFQVNAPRSHLIRYNKQQKRFIYRHFDPNLNAWTKHVMKFSSASTHPGL